MNKQIRMPNISASNDTMISLSVGLRSLLGFAVRRVRTAELAYETPQGMA